jgi:hypothetical protein
VEGLDAPSGLIYLLLGRVGTQWSRDAIAEVADGRARKMSYQDLIKALDVVVNSSMTLAKAYREALVQQLERITVGFGKPDF